MQCLRKESRKSDRARVHPEATRTSVPAFAAAIPLLVTFPGAGTAFPALSPCILE